MEKITNLLDKGVSRRGFIGGVGATAAAGLLAGCSTSTSSTPSTGPTDADVLNFALNLEYLEAEFYLRAATGVGLSATDAGAGAGTVTGGSAVPGLSSTFQQYVNEIAYDEAQHVKFLRSALGSAAVSRPNIDFTNAFTTLAVAAGIISAGSTFNPFADFDSFLVGAFVFEDVGVTAYHGAAGLLQSKSTLGAAAGIMATEAYHAGIVRTILTGRAINAAATSTAYPYIGYANKVATLRGTLGGGNETMLVVPSSLTTPSSIVAADATSAVAFSRSTDQVLHIVYGTPGGAGVKSGVFFPNGLNGNISVTTS